LITHAQQRKVKDKRNYVGVCRSIGQGFNGIRFSDLDMTSALKPDVTSFRRPDGVAGIETMVGHYVTQTFKPHAHGEFVIGLIDRGSHAVWCRGEQHSVTGSTIVTMRPGDIHFGGAAADCGWVQRMVYIDEMVMADLVSEGFERPHGTQPDFGQTFWPDRDLADAFRRYHGALHSAPSRLASDSALEALVHVVVGQLAPSLMRDPDQRQAPASVAAIRDYLHAHVERNVSLLDLCRVSGLGRRQTIDLFKRHTGLPPHAYHLGLKIDAARRLLLSGVPTAEVAALVGFADQSHMTRHFKAIVGTTPSAYKAAA
jgi:AraC-like DNA-binding protein